MEAMLARKLELLLIAGNHLTAEANCYVNGGKNAIAIRLAINEYERKNSEMKDILSR